MSELIEKVYERGDIVCAEDGFYIFWPIRNHGALNSHNLREIADELDRRNEEWSKQVNDFFNKLEENQEPLGKEFQEVLDKMDF